MQMLMLACRAFETHWKCPSIICHSENLENLRENAETFSTSVQKKKRPGTLQHWILMLTVAWCNQLFWSLLVKHVKALSVYSAPELRPKNQKVKQDRKYNFVFSSFGKWLLAARKVTTYSNISRNWTEPLQHTRIKSKPLLINYALLVMSLYLY